MTDRRQSSTWMRFPLFVSVLLAVLFTLSGKAMCQERIVSPKLVICGGGALPKSVIQRFRDLCGSSPRLVVIPTATSRQIDRDEIESLWKSRGFDDVRILHSEDPEEVSTPSFSDPLKDAAAVWFGGGSQQRIADAYLNTPVEKELQNLLKRGGVIGGTSAGAAIQSRVMIASGNPVPKLSKGLDLLPNAIIDQHFLRRNRIPRLMSAVKAKPTCTGFGIDEGTALIVQGDQATVVGNSYVLRFQIDNGNVKVDAFNSGEAVPLAKLK